MRHWPVKKYLLDAPSLNEIASILNSSLKGNFKDVTVSVTTCPNLQQAPFNLAGIGLSGNERIADIGGPPYLHPLPQFDRKYSLLEISKLMEMSKDTGFMLGAGAGPFDVIGVNSELMPNLSYDGHNVTNLTHYAKVDEKGGCVCKEVPGKSTGFALMANLFGCDGRSGEVLKIVVKARTGKLNFTAAVQKALKDEYGERPVSLGGVFVIKSGKMNIHVMPDFSKELLDKTQVNDWLKYFEMRAPMVCLTTFHSHDPGLDLRMEHTHCFSNRGEGGHYHFDTTPDDVEYEAYFNTAKLIYRIDQPPI